MSNVRVYARQIQWTGSRQMFDRLQEYDGSVRRALHAVAEYFAPIVESYAKDNAPWIDRTGNARQGLTGSVQDISQTVVHLYLSHKMDYGVYLELKHSGRYAIILPTLEAHYGEIKKRLDSIFSQVSHG